MRSTELLRWPLLFFCCASPVNFSKTTGPMVWIAGSWRNPYICNFMTSVYKNYSTFGIFPEQTHQINFLLTLFPISNAESSFVHHKVFCVGLCSRFLTYIEILIIQYQHWIKIFLIYNDYLASKENNTTVKLWLNWIRINALFIWQMSE